MARRPELGTARWEPQPGRRVTAQGSAASGEGRELDLPNEGRGWFLSGELGLWLAAGAASLWGGDGVRAALCSFATRQAEPICEGQATERARTGDLAVAKQVAQLKPCVLEPPRPTQRVIVVCALRSHCGTPASRQPRGRRWSASFFALGSFRRLGEPRSRPEVLWHLPGAMEDRPTHGFIESPRVTELWKALKLWKLVLG